MENDERTMRILAVVALTALGGMGSLPASAQNVQLPLNIYVQTDTGDPRLALIRHGAQDVAARMLTKAGVQVIWHTGAPHEEKGEPPITIEIRSHVPQAFHRGSFAYAEVFGGAHITVLYERLEYRDGAHATTMLLAHVLAHEITHVLESLDHHSQQGIMKAHWTHDDLVQMSRSGRFRRGTAPQALNSSAVRLRQVRRCDCWIGGPPRFTDGKRSCRDYLDRKK